MRRTVFTVASEYQIPNAIVLMQSVEKYLPEAERILYVVDADQDRIDAVLKDVPIAVSAFSARELFGEKFFEYAFYFDEYAFLELVKIKALAHLSESRPCVLLADFNVELQRVPALPSPENCPMNAVTQVYGCSSPLGAKLPDSFLYTYGSDGNAELFQVTAGDGTRRFLKWCMAKIDHLLQTLAYQAPEASPSSYQPDDGRFFVYSWQRYSKLFSLQTLGIPMLFQRITDETQSYEIIPASDYLVFSFRQASKRNALAAYENLISQYYNRVQKLREDLAVRNAYGYNFFFDGTPVFYMLRYYFLFDARLRDACQRNPFEHRELFTDTPSLFGDDSRVLMNVAAESMHYCRPDLRNTFPFHRSSQRLAYIEWFLRSGAPLGRLGAVYTEPVRQAFERCRKQQHLLMLRLFLARVKRLVKQKLVWFLPKLLRVAGRYEKRFKRYFIERVRKIRLRRRRSGPPAVPRFLPMDSLRPFGVNLHGFIRGDFGLGEATRILAATFEKGNVPFTIINYETPYVHRYENRTWDAKITNEFPYRISVHLTNINGIVELFETIAPPVINGRYNIGYLYWELPELDPSWAYSIEYFDEIWTASEFCAQSFRAYTKKPVRVIPCCITVDTDETLGRAYFGLPEDAFLFLVMYDSRSISMRKNPIAAIRAFAGAFGDREDVQLVIKVNILEGFSSEEEVYKLVRHHKNIRIINQTMKKIEVNSLVNACDAFVSLHRSEGFGLGPAEAMYLGKPAILTNWSGNTQYMTADNCCPVDYTITEIKHSNGPYLKGFHWAEADAAQASRYMLRLVGDRAYYDAISQNARRHIREQFSPEAVGALALARFREIAGEAGGR